jgi:N6-adenosine-specific RNA methylase IME4
MNNELIKLDEATRLLAEVKDLKEIKPIIDTAVAAEIYAKKVLKSEEAEQYARSIKLTAQRKAGIFLKGSPRLHGARPADTGSLDVTPLKDIGITKRQSSDWQKLAEIPEESFEKIKEGTKTLKQAKQEVKREKKREDIKAEAKMPTGSFDVIYADPPWQYSNSGFSMSAEQQYPTMNIDDLCSMDIPSKDNAVLFLWVTNPLLEDAMKLVKAWGFEYKTNIVWIKEKHTAGFYVFGQHELLFICVKGEMVPYGEKVKSIINGVNKIHSKKPNEVYGIIESMYPDAQYLEMFARQAKEGWSAFGNQV